MGYGKTVIRQVLTGAVFVSALGVLFALNLLMTPPEILIGERRVPTGLPEFSARALLSASFMNKFEGYAADRFPFRDGFRALRAATVLDILRQGDKSGIYRDKAVGLGQFQGINETMWRQTAEKIQEVAGRLTGLHIYYSVIPDKSVFASRYLPGYDHAAAEEILAGELAGFTYLPLQGQLGAVEYYKTDLHWDQTRIAGVSGYLLSSMGSNTADSQSVTVTAGAFRGLYAGQLGLPVSPDTMTYADLPNLTASYLNEKTLQFERGDIYAPERFSDVDPYDVFLRGPQPLIVIENSTAKGGRELYLFRDSFGSSLAPLLAGGYAKVTVIDLRYIHADLLSRFVTFKPGSDVLFIYGSQIFNNPDVLQV